MTKASEVMTQNENDTVQDAQQPAAPVNRRLDFTFLLAMLWLRKYTLLIFLCIGVIFGVVWMKGTPREYDASITLMPESMGGNNATSSQLALMMGISVSSRTDDAYSPLIYPDLVSSIPFLAGLFDVEVQTSTGDTTYTVRSYVKEKMRRAWWKSISLPGPSAATGDATVVKGDNEMVDPFRLTPAEMNIVNQLRSRIWASMDKKTGEIEIGVTMQDPLVAAQLADTVAARLQEYLVDYRTAKARHDLEYAITLNEEAKKQYFEAQQAYAEYMDRNQGLALYSAQTVRDRLDNDMKLAFNLYNSTAQRVQTNEAKVQEETPVFAVVNPASVPLYPIAPSAKRIFAISIGGWLFIGIVVALFPVLVGRRMADIVRNERAERRRRKEEKQNGSHEDSESDPAEESPVTTIEIEEQDTYYVMDGDSDRRDDESIQ